MGVSRKLVGVVSSMKLVELQKILSCREGVFHCHQILRYGKWFPVDTNTDLQGGSHSHLRLVENECFQYDAYLGNKIRGEMQT